MKGFWPHLWLTNKAKVKQIPVPVGVYFHCKRMLCPPHQKKKKKMHQAFVGELTLWHTVHIPPALLEAQVRSASLCEEQWEEKSGMKKCLHPASMLRTMCFCYSLKGYSWVVAGITMCPRPLMGVSLRSGSGLGIPYRQKNMYHIAITYYRSNATRM